MLSYLFYYIDSGQVRLLATAHSTEAHSTENHSTEKKSIRPNFFNIDNMKFRVYANLSDHNMSESGLNPCKSSQ